MTPRCTGYAPRSAARARRPRILRQIASLSVKQEVATATARVRPTGTTPALLPSEAIAQAIASAGADVCTVLIVAMLLSRVPPHARVEQPPRTWRQLTNVSPHLSRMSNPRMLLRRRLPQREQLLMLPRRLHKRMLRSRPRAMQKKPLVPQLLPLPTPSLRPLPPPQGKLHRHPQRLKPVRQHRRPSLRILPWILCTQVFLTRILQDGSLVWAVLRRSQGRNRLSRQQK